MTDALTTYLQDHPNERSGLEKQWDRGDNVSTEDLRRVHFSAECPAEPTRGTVAGISRL